MSWLTGWDHAKKLTIRNNNIDSDLTDVTVPVVVDNDSDLSDALATGNDIRFTDSDGTTLLNHDRESWSGGGGSNVTTVYWVKMSLVNATAKEFYIYWGKSDATSGEDKANAWDSATLFRSDMADKTTSTINDSISTTDGSKAAANEPTEVTGQIGKGQDFDGLNDRIDCGSRSGLNTGTTRTITAWINTSDTGSGTTNCTTIIARINSSSPFNGFTLTIGRNTAGKLSYWDSTNVREATSNTYNSGQWVHVGIVHSGITSLKFYKDGVEDGSLTSISSPTDSTENMMIGSQAAIRFFNGLIDEPRLANVARSAAWIKFDHAITKAPNTETTWGAKLDAPAAGIAIPIINYRRQHLAA